MVALYFLLQAVVGAVVGLVGIFVYAFIQGATGHHFGAAAIGRLLHEPSIKTGLTIIVLAIVAALTLWLTRRFWREQWSVADPPGFGFVRPERPWMFFAMAVAAAVALAYGGSWLTEFLAHGHAFHQDVSVMGKNVPLGMRIALAALVVCVAPLIEELLFRGVLLSGLMRRMPVWPAILVSALIFGGAHLPDFKFAWYPIPDLMLLGVALAWLRVKSRSLWPSVAMHATNNLLAAIGWFVVAHPPHG